MSYVLIGFAIWFGCGLAFYGIARLSWERRTNYPAPLSYPIGILCGVGSLGCLIAELQIRISERR